MSEEIGAFAHVHERNAESPKVRVELPRGPRRPRKRPDWQGSGPLSKAAGMLRKNRERGDVPGWVLITLMTAGLVVAIWAIAGPALEGLFDEAIAKITEQAG